MKDSRPMNRPKQAVAWFFLLIFAAGFFLPAIGAWTGPVTGAWFAGTQRPLRGAIWLLIFTFLPALGFGLWGLPHAGAAQILTSAGWLLLGAVLSVFPLTFLRLTAPRLPEFAATLALPLAGVEMCALAHSSLPAAVALRYFAHSGVSGEAMVFLHLWLASTLLWAWNLEFRKERIRRGGFLFLAIVLLTEVVGLCVQAIHPNLSELPAQFDLLLWCCVAGSASLAIWAAVHPVQHERPWRERQDSIAFLRSPATGAAIQYMVDEAGEALMSAQKERFAIHDGIPAFVKPEEVVGANRKYNQLYETIAGFYDDTQRVGAALIGMDRDGYVRSYLNKIEIRPGDRVLETSVGTGLNFKYLPEGVHLSGLDLSGEMLANCQTNLRRWRMQADLYLGNAEYLPFADESFDVVFHVGGINFFSDRKRAVDEMIRVAKPGSLILIADETEEHVQKAYQNMPYTQEFYKNRNDSVSAPVDLLPAEVEDVQAEIVWGNRFYALTFRKALRAADHCMELTIAWS
jgi:ubiquinone/menaquinone biosynthesis C-methylase UbiE